MIPATITKAKKLLEEDKIKLVGVFNNLYHFHVKQTNSKWADVYLTMKRIGGVRVPNWSCGVVSLRRKTYRCEECDTKHIIDVKRKFSYFKSCDVCNFRNLVSIDNWTCLNISQSDRSKPYCSHCYSAYLLLEQMGLVPEECEEK